MTPKVNNTILSSDFKSKMYFAFIAKKNKKNKSLYKFNYNRLYKLTSKIEHFYKFPMKSLYKASLFSQIFCPGYKYYLKTSKF